MFSIENIGKNKTAKNLYGTFGLGLGVALVNWDSTVKIEML